MKLGNRGRTVTEVILGILLGLVAITVFILVINSTDNSRRTFWDVRCHNLLSIVHTPQDTIRILTIETECANHIKKDSSESSR